MRLPDVSLVTVNYNSSDFVRELVESVINSLKYCNYCLDVELIVVDNASKRDDYDNLRVVTREPELKVKVWRSGVNLGYAGGVNLGVRMASGDVVIVSNPDIVLGDTFFRELYVLINSKVIRAKIIAPKIIIKNKELINSKGLDLHIAGYGILRGLGEPATSRDNPSIVVAPHGALFIARRDNLLELGPFDPSLYAFLEDLDLGLRAWSRGYPTVYYPRLVAYHYWGVSWGKHLSRVKYYLAERNRLIVLLRDLPGRQIASSLPFTALSEIISSVYAFSQGYPSLKARIYGEILVMLPKLVRWRARILNREGEALLQGVLERSIEVEFKHVVFDEKRIALVNRLFKGLAMLVSRILKLNGVGGR